eukprot:348103-Alexandrium_andersonii.AAC.2
MPTSRQHGGFRRIIRTRPTGPPVPTARCFARRHLHGDQACRGHVGLGGNIGSRVRRGRRCGGRCWSLASCFLSSHGRVRLRRWGVGGARRLCAPARRA